MRRSARAANFQAMLNSAPRRACRRITLEDVPHCPVGSAALYSDDKYRVYDCVLDDSPCRWRYDGNGLKAFFRYYPDHHESTDCPWQELYSRDGK